MIKRDIGPFLKQMAKEYPVVTITGPRQSGKTTLAQSFFQGYGYANLEDVEMRQLAETDSKAFFTKYPPPVVIDEIQRVPTLTSAIQVWVDRHREQRGQLILTGSQQLHLHHSVSQSLAGRTALLTLLPLSIDEIRNSHGNLHADELIWRGFMPELYHAPVSPTHYYRNYFQTYVERDVRHLLQIRNLAAFERFMVLLAGRVGQLVNLSGLAGETGVSSTTIAEWLSILEASYIIFRLQPFHSNISKRTVKSPKLYFVETGLAAYLLGLENPSQVSRDPLRGNLFENMVIADVLKARMNRGQDSRLYFLRTEKGFEIDLVLQRGRALYPVEIKSAMTFHAELTENIRTFCKATPAAQSPALIYAGENYPERQGVACLHYTQVTALAGLL